MPSPVTLPSLFAVATPRGAGPGGSTIPRMEATAGGAKPTVDAVLRSVGIRAPAEAVTSLQANAAKGPLTAAEVEKILSDPDTTKHLGKLSGTDRMAAKSALWRAGLMSAGVVTVGPRI